MLCGPQEAPQTLNPGSARPLTHKGKASQTCKSETQIKTTAIATTDFREGLKGSDAGADAGGRATAFGKARVTKPAPSTGRENWRQSRDLNPHLTVLLTPVLYADAQHSWLYARSHAHVHTGSHAHVHMPTQAREPPGSHEHNSQRVHTSLNGE